MTSERMQRRIKSSVSIDHDGCWIWQKSHSWNGYGRFALGGGNNIGAHRASFLAFKGEIPSGLDVCHSCDVRSCVNPDHLFVGTRQENILDCVKKGRHRQSNKVCGSKHPSAKLNEWDVAEILERLSRSETKASIARRYGVSDRVILLISRGVMWKHVTRAA